MPNNNLKNNNQNSIPLSLYVHIPWCARKCPYCDFNSHHQTNVIDENAYRLHLKNDLMHDYDGRIIHSIFIGGGTPSILSTTTINNILNDIAAIAHLDSNCEITLEANPGSSEYKKIKQFKEIGINRLSLGVQSFNDQHLKELGRIHSAKEALKAIEQAYYFNFKNINIDIMYALPQQTISQALNDLQIASAQPITHLSWYQLTIEVNTPFYRHPPPLPDDDLKAEIYQQGANYLQYKEFKRYEISAWHRGAPCKHNINYWQFGDYIGIGAGAHGKITNANGDIIRSSKYSHPNRYQCAQSKYNNPYIDRQYKIDKCEQPFEFMMNALRLTKGIPTTYLEKRTQIKLNDIYPTLIKLVQKKLINENIKQQLQTTTLGYDFLNDVLREFLP